MDLKKHIRSIPDYPKKGILFRDITTLIKTPEAFKYTNNKILEFWSTIYWKNYSDSEDMIRGDDNRIVIMRPPKYHENDAVYKKRGHGFIFEDRILIFFTQPLDITAHGMRNLDFEYIVN